MLILKGDNGKSRVLDALIHTYKDDCIGIVYENHPFNTPLGALRVDADAYDIKEFCEELPMLAENKTKDEFCSMVVVYTNLKESEISDIKNVVEKLEKEHYFAIGIVMCKE